jgi:hypothetical protein
LCCLSSLWPKDWSRTVRVNCILGLFHIWSSGLRLLVIVVSQHVVLVFTFGCVVPSSVAECPFQYLLNIWGHMSVCWRPFCFFGIFWVPIFCAFLTGGWGRIGRRSLHRSLVLLILFTFRWVIL